MLLSLVMWPHFIMMTRSGNSITLVRALLVHNFAYCVIFGRYIGGSDSIQYGRKVLSLCCMADNDSVAVWTLPNSAALWSRINQLTCRSCRRIHGTFHVGSGERLRMFHLHKSDLPPAHFLDFPQICSSIQGLGLSWNLVIGLCNIFPLHSGWVYPSVS